MGTVTEKNLPKLRFPEFTEPWQVKRGKELFGNRRSRGNESLPIYSVTLTKGVVPRDSLARQMGADAAADSHLRAEPGDLIYNMMRMWQGAVGRTDVDCMISPAYVVLAPTKEVDSTYFAYNLQRARSLYNLWAYSYGLTDDRLRLYYRDFGFIKFHVPPLPEQAKISTVLATVDEKLKALRRQRELLQTYKRGMMQKIFSQELRFKADDGGEFPEWVEREFDTLAHRVADKTSPNNTNEMLPCIELDSLESGSGKLLSTYKFASQSSLKGLFRPNDVLFGKLRPYLRKFYMPTFSGVCSSEIWILRGTTIIQSFLYYLVQTSRFDWACNKSSGSKMPRADWHFIGQAPFWVPKSKPEQQKIADFLSAIDARIDAVAGQIEKMVQFKKGLLQQLFV